MPEAPPTGPNAETPRGAAPKAPNAIAEGKGMISSPDPIDKLHVDGMESPHPADATQPDRGEQPQPAPEEAPKAQRIAETRVAENLDAFKSGSDNASI